MKLSLANIFFSSETVLSSINREGLRADPEESKWEKKKISSCVMLCMEYFTEDYIVSQKNLFPSRIDKRWNKTSPYKLEMW